jgi:hypothetical protein
MTSISAAKIGPTRTVAGARTVCETALTPAA